MNTILLFLQDSLSTQSPKIVLIETGLVDFITEDTDLDGQIYYSSRIPFSINKLEYITTFLGAKIDSKHIELPIVFLSSNSIS